MKIYNYIKLFIFIAFSVLLFIFKEELVADLNFFVGSLILAFGVENIIVIVITQRRKSIRRIRFSFSLFEIILGLTILTAVKDFAYVCVMWAVWSLLRQSIDINEVFRGELSTVMSLIVLSQSIVSIVFSIMLILDQSEHHAITHLYLLIAELMVIALPPVVDELRYQYKKKKR